MKASTAVTKETIKVNVKKKYIYNSVSRLILLERLLLNTSYDKITSLL